MTRGYQPAEADEYRTRIRAVIQKHLPAGWAGLGALWSRSPSLRSSPVAVCPHVQTTTCSASDCSATHSWFGGRPAGTSLDWIFLLVRTDPDAPKHKGISTLLNVVGPVNSGWKGAMTLLGFERGVARPLIRTSGNCWLGATAGSH